ncbi:MAG: iron-sulfur cluster repair di-iron protein [Saprospiraceae bacterium]|nr:iron-sulfur cluster repair di-iron protein [Saprospiraceae bacterium]
MKISEQNRIGEIVAKNYRTASVFKSFGVDFCCKGQRTLQEVCEKDNIRKAELLDALELSFAQESASDQNFNHWPIDLLVDYIEKTHHRYVRNRIPEILEYLDKLCKVHGKRYPELNPIKELFQESCEALLSHMQKEEKILFPRLRQLATIKNEEGMSEELLQYIMTPIDVMRHEHDVEGNRFREISELAKGYVPPEAACATHRVTFSMLEEFEEDLHKHIHLENNILFPKALRLKDKLAYA